MATARIPAEIVAEDKFTPELRKIQNEIARTNQQLGAFGSVLKGIGQGVSLGLIVRAFQSVVDGLDQIEERSQALGLTISGLQEIQYAAQFSGIGVENLDVALSRLNKQLDAAGAGSKEASRTFNDLGIKVKEANGAVISTEEALLQIADKFKTYRDGAEKSALAQELFGRSGAKLIPFLNQGREGLEKLREEARKLGIVMGEDDVKAAAQFNDEVDKLKTVVLDLARDLVGTVLPTLNRFAQELQIGLSTFGSFKEALIQGGWNVDPFKSLDENIKASRDEIDKLYTKMVSMQDAAGDDIDGGVTRRQAEAEIKRIERRIEYLRQLKNLRGEGVFEANFPASSGTVTPPRGTRGTPPKAKKETIDAETKAYEAYINKLNEAIAQTEEMSIVERTLYEIRKGSFGTLNEGQQEMLVMLAAQAQAVENQRIRERTLADERKAADAQRKSDIETIKQLTGEADEERADRLLRLIEAEVVLGNISHEQAEKAKRALLGIAGAAADTKDSVEQLGVMMLSSLGKWIEGDTDKNFFQSLLEDLKKVIVQMFILNPLIEEMQRLLKAQGGGKITTIVDILKLISGAGGSAAYGGQIFGKGGYLQPGQFGIAGDRGPEVIYGGRTGMTVWPSGTGTGGVTIHQTINVDSRSDRATIMQAMLAAKDQAKAEIMQSMNTNGAFARR
jgi:hypothetical protein